MFAVETKGISIILACRTFGVSERCYRYERRLRDENAVIADWLWTYNNERPNMAIGGITPATKLKMAA